MARTAIPTSTTNDLVTAAWFNTYLRDNEAAHWAVIGANEAAIGKIYSGRVAAAGTAIKLPSGWSSSKLTTGKYRVTHNLGTANYTVVGASVNKFWALTVAQGTNYFDCQVMGHDNADGLMKFYDEQFHFILIKD
jgi:hypothetical protein